VASQLPFLHPELTRHWRYYLLLEAEFETALRYIEPDPSNMETFSLEFARQILATCAQFETVAKLLCERRVPGSNPKGIKGIRTTLLSWQPVTGWRTRFYPQNALLSPFSDWTDEASPPWWLAYNKIKHEPAAYVQLATLGNALNSLAAVGLVTIAYLEVNAQPGTSRLFDLHWP
jgi:hypothetical protein